jgi:hypothetical protein
MPAFKKMADYRFQLSPRQALIDHIQKSKSSFIYAKSQRLGFAIKLDTM